MGDLSDLAPAGHYIALRVGFAFPLEERNMLPDAWVEQYTNAGYMLFDPLIRWVYGHVGSIRWSEIGLDDPRGVLIQARRYGLNHGVAISIVDDEAASQRSFGTFARSDREFFDDEIAVLTEHLRQLHIDAAPPSNLTNAELEALLMVKQGLRMKQIAHELGVSEGAIKQRLRNAKLKLNAATSAQAAAKASGFGLI